MNPQTSQPSRHSRHLITPCTPRHQLLPQRRRHLAAVRMPHPESFDPAERGAGRPGDGGTTAPRHLRSTADPDSTAPRHARDEPVVASGLMRCDVYATATRGVEELTLLLAQRLNIVFIFRDSSECGEHYDYHGPGGEKIEVKPNVEDEDGSLVEAAYPACRTFVYVSQSYRSDVVANVLDEIGDVAPVRCEFILER